MKKWLRTLLCTLLLTTLILPAAATTPEEFQAMLETAGPGLLIAPNPNAKPQKQGDFYVLVNGKYVTFPDAVPQLKNGRSCLPFVAVFEQLGFAEEDMTWNGETSTVTATKHNISYSTPFTNGEVRQGSVTVTLTIGSTEFLVSYSGDTTADSRGHTVPVVYAYETEAAPYLDLPTKRTYIPFGLVADALGYNVGWDAEEGTVIIDDVDAILTTNSATYEHMEDYLDWHANFSSSSYKVKGNYGYEFALSDPETGLDTELSYDGTYDMITNGGNSAFDYKADLEMDMAFRLNGEDMTDLFLALSGESSPFPVRVSMQMRGDKTTNLLYTRTDYPDGSSAAADPAIPEGAWVKTPLDSSDTAAFASLSDGMLFSALGLEPDTTDFRVFLKALLSDYDLTDADATCTDYLAYINSLFSDQALEQSGHTYTSRAVLENRSFALTLYTDWAGVNGYSYTLTEREEDGTSTMTATMKDLHLDWSVTSELDGGSFTMQMTGDYTPTSLTPSTLPPKDAVIIDQTGSAE